MIEGAVLHYDDQKMVNRRARNLGELWRLRVGCLLRVRAAAPATEEADKHEGCSDDSANQTHDDLLTKPKLRFSKLEQSCTLEVATVARKRVVARDATLLWLNCAKEMAMLEEVKAADPRVPPLTRMRFAGPRGLSPCTWPGRHDV